MDATSLRAAFPVLERVAYLNAGTCGPVPAAALDAAVEQLRRETEEGRAGMAHWDRRRELAAGLRAAYAARLGCAPDDVALTSSTTDGVTIALGGLDLGPGDEVLTSDTEHPGVVGPLQALRDLRGVAVRTVPLAELASAAGSATRAVACSHVSWLTGEVAPVADLAALDVPVVLDGAQGVGAVPVDVVRWGAVVYAGSGQKWLCGPEGLGMLYIAPELQERLGVIRRWYGSYEDPNAGMDAVLAAGARRFDPPANHGSALLVHALAAQEVLGELGWDEVYERSATLAAGLAQRLAEQGHDVMPRGRTTLVAWRDTDMEATAKRLGAAGIAVRHLPGRDLVRASVGAWNDESDVDRLLAALAG
jgi:L-cysteine/cystine lyase